jgi:D-xylonolactonase
VTAPNCVWPLAALLGEGPVWDIENGAVWFVDIKGGYLHRFDPADNSSRSYFVGGNPSFVLPTDAGGLLIGNGVALTHWRQGAADQVAAVEMLPGNRCNDATVDTMGRVWFGTMDNDEMLSTGLVYRLDRGSLVGVGGGAVITNGPAISANGRWLYHVDTLAGTIWRFDIATHDDLRDGNLFASIDPRDGTPDGVTIDAEDHLWVGLWGGWCARRYAPDGRVVDEIQFPCANITKVAFGGPDLSTIYATTARAGLSEMALLEQPLAGGLFAADVEVPGRPLPLAKLR